MNGIAGKSHHEPTSNIRYFILVTCKNVIEEFSWGVMLFRIRGL